MKIPDMIVNTIAGLYWRIEGYSSTMEAPKVSMQPITVDLEAVEGIEIH